MTPFHFTFAAAIFMAGATSLHAHHGQEFFLLYDARVQQPWHGMLQGNFSFTHEGPDDSLALSPSLSVGVFPRTAFNLRADFTAEGAGGWAFRALEPGIQFDLTPSRLKLPVRLGLAVSYQFSGGSDHSGTHHGTADLSGRSIAHRHDDKGDHQHQAAHDHNTHDHGKSEATTPSVDLGPDALTPGELAEMEAGNSTTTNTPAASKTNRSKPRPKSKPLASNDHSAEGHSHHSSIHNHEDNLLATRLIIEADLTPDTVLIGNLINVLPHSGSAAWGYAIGVRHRFSPALSAGVEALGDFRVDGHQEVLGAVFLEPMPHVLLKVGVGTGLTSVSPDATFRAGILWMF